MNKPFDPPDTVTNSTASSLDQILQAREASTPELAAKQLRLIQILKQGTKAVPQKGLSGSGTTELPPAPTRENFPTQEEFEEARGGWISRVGRIKGLVGAKKTEV